MEKNRQLEKNKLEILKKQCKPSSVWQQYLDTDDEMGVFYTQEGIDGVSGVLDKFIDELINLNDFTNNDDIIKLIYNVIIDLNELSHKYDGMIETNEREELVDFILTILDTIEFEYDGDITEQWREW